MRQLSAAQIVELKRLWSERSVAYPRASPPENDDEVVAAALDAWIAGAVSSEGRVSSASIDDLADVIRDLGAQGPATALAQRAVAVARPPR